MQNDPTTYPFKGTFKPHQLRALRESDLKTGHAWWCDPGAGKTALAIGEASELFERDLIDAVLIFAPNGPHLQWLDEQFPLWCAVKYKTYHNKISPAALRDRLLEPRPKMYPEMAVAAVNFESVAAKNGKDFIAKFMEKYPRIYLIVDESQKAKEPKAARTKEILRLRMSCAYGRVLSGTPILNGLENLWSQYEIARPGMTGHAVGKNRNGTTSIYGYTSYKAYYCVEVPVSATRNAGKMIVGYRNEKELQIKTKPFVTRVMSDEFMKGEKPDFMTVSCPMTAEQTKAYAQMSEHLLAQIDGGMIDAQNALVQLGKLTQIASGFIYDEEQNVHAISRNKIDAALTLMEGLANEPVLIWSPFVPLKRMMAEALQHAGYPFIEYVDRDSVQRWKEEGGVMLGNQGSGLGVGQNLQHCAANIYLANLFGAEARWQSLKRTDRMGQERQVRVWDLMAPGTTDHKVRGALQRKQDISIANIDVMRELLL